MSKADVLLDFRQMPTLDSLVTTSPFGHSGKLLSIHFSESSTNLHLQYNSSFPALYDHLSRSLGSSLLPSTYNR